MFKKFKINEGTFIVISYLIFNAILTYLSIKSLQTMLGFTMPIWGFIPSYVFAIVLAPITFVIAILKLLILGF